MSARDDYQAGGEAGYTGSDAFGVMPGDAFDNAQMAPFAPQGTGMAWWESLITYGATRAIDNRFAPVNVAGNMQPGSYAGANGRTYQSAPTGQGGAAAGFAGMSSQTMLLLAGAAALAFVAMR